MKIWTAGELGPNTIHLVMPPGIGDISWCYSKLRHLKHLLGRPVLFQIPDENPQRGGDFISLLPDVHWGGYVQGTNAWRVLSQSLPADWPPYQGWGPLLPRGWPVNIAPNLHLECGRSLASWLPMLPTDYHYALNFPAEQSAEADRIVSSLPRPVFAVYVSNREKEQYKAGGWALWSLYQWTDFLSSVARLPQCKGSFVLLGASWDRDKTEEVAANIERGGHRVHRLIGQPLAVALRIIQRADYGFAYPSGIGILMNVLRTPALMLLPWILRGLEKAYADPFDLATNRYRAWADPTPEEAFRWFRDVSLPQVLETGKWPDK